MNRCELGKRVPDFELIKRLAAELQLPTTYFYAADDVEGELLESYFKLSVGSEDRLMEYLRVLA